MKPTKNNPLIFSCFFFWLFLVCMPSKAQEYKLTNFHPGELWLDQNGEHINAHGGGFLYHNKTYYWFGEFKTTGEEGNRAMVGVQVYTSKDLYNWKNEGVALKVHNDTNSKLVKGCVIERPKVIYNPKTKKFVMWFHHELKGQGYKAALTGVAVADKAIGPYQYLKSFRIQAGNLPQNMTKEAFDAIPTLDENVKLNKQVRIEQALRGEIFKRDFEGGQMSRDMTLFVDDDGSAYHITASEENQTLLISKLADDFLSLSKEFIRIFPGGRNEAPAVFKKDGQYFMFSSGLTGWKPNPGKLSVAKNIMGEWTALENPCRGTEDEKNTTFWSQSTYVIPVAGKKNAFIFAADRWVPDNHKDGRYIWLPIQFDNGIPYLEWHETWDLSIFSK